MFPYYICKNIDILALMTLQKNDFGFPQQLKILGTRASIQQSIFQISSLSNRIKTLKYLPPVQAVIPQTPLYPRVFQTFRGTWGFIFSYKWFEKVDCFFYLEKSRRIPSAFLDLRRKLIFPFSHDWYQKVDQLQGPNETTHEINS